MTTISEAAIKKIRGNQRCMGRLVTHFNKHYMTIIRWLDEKNVILVTPDAVQIITEETELTRDEILEESNGVEREDNVPTNG